MTSNPTTPISIRRNNLSSHCDSDVTVSRIPIPSPGTFRRSVSLRMRGSKSCLFSPSTGIITKTSTPIPINDEKRIINTKTMAASSLLPRSSSPTLISSKSKISPSTSSSCLKTNELSSNDMFRPTATVTDSSSQMTTDTSFHINRNSEPEEITNNGSVLETTIVKQEITAEKTCSNNQFDFHKNDDQKMQNYHESLTKTMENNLNLNSPGQNQNVVPSSTSSSCPSVGKKNNLTNKRDPNGMSLNLNGPTVSSSTAVNCSIESNTNRTTTPKTPYTPKTPTSGPLAKATPKTPPVTPDSPHIYLDDDLDSVYSYSSATSGRSTMSCEHPYVARNGTTFSGRKMKYVVHCSSYAGQVGEDYLTPTQRAQKQLRRLKELLIQARQDLEQKDSEILRLTREVVELRLFKASLSSPEDRSNSSDAVTVREATTDLKTSQDVSPIVDMIDEGGTVTSKSSPRHTLHNHHHGINQVQFLEKMSSSEMQSSFADSGHFEDMTTSSVHSKDSFVHTQDRACGTDGAASLEEQRQELIRMYEKRIEELIKNQDTTTSEMKRTHNDKVEALLQKLAECNSRYADLVPDYEQAKERIRELEKQLEDLQRKLQEQEETQKKVYLHMYTKEQEAERIAQADQMLELAHRPQSRVSISELLKQLQSTQDELENIRASNYRSQSGSSQVLLTAKEAISLWVLGARKTIYRRLLEAQENKTRVDPEVTLQFLKSAIYYFLTDKENSQGHLNAIQSILEFSEQEKQNISKARSSK